MPFDGSGNFSRDYNWQQDRDNDIRILAERMDGEFDNYAGGLNQTFLRTGIVPMQGTLNMNNNSVIGITAGTAASPGIKFNGDPNSGFYLASLNSLGFSTNGLNRMTIGNTGVTIAQNLTVSGTTTLTGNILGTPSFAGTVLFQSGLTITDANYALSLVSGDPRITVDTGDMYSYNRTTNTHRLVIGSADQFTVTTAQVTAAPVILAGAGVNFVDANFNTRVSGGNPVLSFDTGDNITYSRAGNSYGFNIGSASKATLDSAGVLTVDSTVIAPVLNTGSGMYMHVHTGGTVPQLVVDSGDYYQYDRTNNIHGFYVASTRYAYAATGGLGVTTGAGFILDGAATIGTSNCALSIASGTPTWTMDNNDGFRFDRGTNTFQFVINGTNVLTSNAGGATIVSGTTIGTAVGAVGNARLNVGGAGANQMGYLSTYRFDGVEALRVGEYGTGGAQYNNLLGNGHAFTGGTVVINGAGLQVPAGQNVQVDGATGLAALTLSGTAVTLTVDSGDAFRFQRSTNAFEFALTSTVVAAITATEIYNGTATSGNELGYEDLKQGVTSGSFTLTLAQKGGHLLYTGAGGHNITIPPNSTTAFPIGSAIVIVNDGAGTMNLLRGAGVTLHYALGSPTNADRTLATKGMCTVLKTGTDTWYVSGVGLV